MDIDHPLRRTTICSSDGTVTPPSSMSAGTISQYADAETFTAVSSLTHAQTSPSNHEATNPVPLLSIEDDLPLEIEERSIFTRWGSMPGDLTGHGMNCWKYVWIATILLAGTVRVGLIHLLLSRHHHETSTPTRPPMPSVLPSQRPSPLPNPSRHANVTRCAASISGYTIGQTNMPRWKAVEELSTGRAREVMTSDCEKKGSLFSTVYSLLVIRESLDIVNPSWTSAVRSLSDVCRWHRVVCEVVDGAPMVSEMSFNHVEELAGTLPPELAALEGLKALELFSNTDLVGPIPTELGSLANLERLEIHFTGLSGTVPTELGHLKSLTTLRAYGTQLSGDVPKEICSLPNLITLEADCVVLACNCCTACKSRKAIVVAAA